ncbi:MAG: selenium cofactor biosynthesis protein YqeC [Anaerolineales bacterium]
MKLSRALRVQPGMIIALVGSGGKTTTMMKLAEETSPAAPVLLATTTHLALRETERVSNRLLAGGPDWLSVAATRLRRGDPLLLTGPIDAKEGKAGAVSESQWTELRARLEGQSPIVVVEADGARGRPLKAPLEHEPAIPSGTSLVVLVVGMDGIGKPLEETSVHRADRFAQLAGTETGAILTPELAARALRHREGYLSKIPRGARFVVFLNQSEDSGRRGAAEDLARRVLEYPEVSEVLIGSVNSPDPIQQVKGRAAGVVLAAGGSRRMGEPKLLKKFRGRPLVSHAVDLALRTTQGVVVVLGANPSPLRMALAGQGVRWVENPLWEQGQSTSLRAGVESLDERFHSVLFFLGDQPLIPEPLVRRLVACHEETLSPLVAPRVAGRQGNPVLFDRGTWPALLELRGDVGGRGLVDRYPVEWIEWRDEEAFLDVDKAEDYETLLGLE